MHKQVAIITVSDKAHAGLRVDASAPALHALLEAAGYEIAVLKIVPDEREALSAVLLECTDELMLPLVLTTGGTGFSPRDITPEVTSAVIERPTPGLSEAMRSASLQITSRAMLSRGVSGIRKRSLIINLPGSPKACTENLDAILEPLSHGLRTLLGESHECAAGEIVSIHRSEVKGTIKTQIPGGYLQEDHGLVGDAHAGPGIRQVSLLASESVAKIRDKFPEVEAGAFAENILTRGITLATLPIGTKLQIGAAHCVVSQIGKECHNDGCAIRRAVGDCVMPREGIFVTVLSGGEIAPGDTITVLS